MHRSLVSVIGGDPTLRLGVSPEVATRAVCDDVAVLTERPRRVRCVVAAGASLALVGYLYTLIIRIRVDGSVAPFDVTESVVYGAALASSAAVGSVVALRRPMHPVGWLFIALAMALSVGGAGDAYALDGAVFGDRAAVAPRLALVAGQASFVVWVALLSAVLQLTPTGAPLTTRWRRGLVVSTLGAIVGLAAKAVQDSEFEGPFVGLRNPLALGDIGPMVDVVAAVGITVSMLGFVVAAASLVVRFRRAAGDERQQLRWLTIVVVPLPLFVALSIVGALVGWPVLRSMATGGFVALIPLAAGLSVLRARLYDVERIFSRTAAYTLSATVLTILFVAVAAGLGRVLSGVTSSIAIASAVAAASTVIAAGPVHWFLRDRLDSRFDRGRYEALRVLQQHLGANAPVDLGAAFRAALGSTTVRIEYALEGGARWVDESGIAQSPDASQELEAVEVTARHEVIARALVDERVDRRTLEAIMDEASAELDNVRLRAELAEQLEEVRQSRMRILAAQAAERRRIERNLHDGAQQRLLAVAMELRAGQLQAVTDENGGSHAPLLGRAVEEIGAAIRDLRALANGLRPATLESSGLRGALDELAGRFPCAVELDVTDARFAPAMEDALWFVASECLANVQKHANAHGVKLSVRQVNRDGASTVELRCTDDGSGGARRTGSGLLGMADRIAALGGRLHVHSPLGKGTEIVVEVPCES